MIKWNKYHDKGYTGLANLGNTCFLNSCMQALNHTYELHEVLDSSKLDTNMKKGLADTEIMKEWNELRDIMWKHNGVITPNKFVNNVHRVATIKKREIFTGWSQNDMPEFLLFIIEAFHNSVSRPVSIQITGNIESDTDKLAVKCYEMLKQVYSKEYSEIMELFYGIYVSEIRSMDSKTVHSVHPEHFFVLDLPIPSNSSGSEATSGVRLGPNSSSLRSSEATFGVRLGPNGTQNISITNCFDDYVHVEHLHGDNAWYNEETKQRENIQKRIVFWNLPKILIITLKRFSPDGRHKIDKLVDFPLDNLDLSKYVYGYNRSQYNYELYAICNHIGNTYMGHYTAFVKNAKNEWLHYNDNQVEMISQKGDENDIKKKIVTPMAYCLFYRKKKYKGII